MVEPDAADPAGLLAQSRRALVEGDFGTVQALAERLHAWADAPAALRAWACLHAGMAAWNNHRSEIGVTWAERAATLAQEAADDGLVAQAVALKGACWVLEDRVTEAVSALREAVGRLGEQTPTAARRTVHTAVAVSYRQLGLSRLELDAARRAVDCLEPDAPPGGVVRTWANLVNATEECWRDLAPLDPDGARQLVDDVLPHQARLTRLAGDSPHARTVVDAVYGGLLVAVGRFAEARTCLRAALEGMAATSAAADDWQVEVALLVSLARCERALGDEPAARVAVQRAQAAAGVHRDGVRWPWLLRRLAELAELAGDATEAMRWAGLFHARVLRNGQDAIEAQVASLAVSVNQHVLSREVRQWQDLAHRDPLTGLLNRRAMAREFDAAAGQRRMLGLLDLDHFKHINDAHGHAVGDDVLRAVAERLGATLRQVDRVGRWGGEEFVLLLVGLDAEGAGAYARRLEQQVREQGCDTSAGRLQVTLSGGLVPVRAGESFDAAAARADAWLYRAKAEGRDRVLVEPDAVPGAP